MTVLAEVASRAAAFDDDALAALASRGLLRRARKDLEREPVGVPVEAEGAVVVPVGGHEVRMDTRGPGHATCSCPAVDVCQHIVAATLALATAAADAVPSASEQLLSMPVAALVTHAGKAGYRWAWHVVDDLDEATGVTVQNGRTVAISFARPPVTVRYVGGPLDTMITDAPRSAAARFRVAAVLAYRRAHGIVDPAPEAPTASGPTAGARAQDDARAAVRRTVAAIAEECVSLGLAHLSAGTRERLDSVAVSAQAAGYHRLSRVLRRVATGVQLHLDQHAAADAEHLLDDLAFAYALVAALGAAATGGSAPAHLVGAARSAYVESAPIDLFGLGAVPWRTPSGYLGLTMVFWAPASRSFVTCTDARPEGTAAFDPVRRYRDAGPWTGLGSPQSATGRRVVLGNPLIADGGRLSASEKVQAVVDDWPDAPAGLEAVADWAELARDTRGRGVLSDPRSRPEWAVLQPASFAPACFDEAQQHLEWPLVDGTGSVLTATVAYTPLSAPAVDAIEALRPADLPGGTMLLVRLRADTSIEPITLLRPGGGPAVQPLHIPATEKVTVLRTRRGRADASDPATAHHPHLARARRGLVDLAERGTPRHAGTSALDHVVSRARTQGLVAFPPPAGDDAPAAALLRAHVVCLQYEALAGVRQGVAD